MPHGAPRGGTRWPSPPRRLRPRHDDDPPPQRPRAWVRAFWNAGGGGEARPLRRARRRRPAAARAGGGARSRRGPCREAGHRLRRARSGAPVGGTVANTAETDRFLVRARKTYFGDYLVHLAEGSYDNWSRLADKLREAPSPGPGATTPRATTPRRRGRSPRPATPDRQGLAGVWRIASTSRVPSSARSRRRLRRVLDRGLPPEPRAALDRVRLRERVRGGPRVHRASGLADRIEARAFDFTRDPLPAGADVILLCGNIHAYDRYDRAWRGRARRSPRCPRAAP